MALKVFGLSFQVSDDLRTKKFGTDVAASKSCEKLCERWEVLDTIRGAKSEVVAQRMSQIYG